MAWYLLNLLPRASNSRSRCISIVGILVVLRKLGDVIPTFQRDLKAVKNISSAAWRSVGLQWSRETGEIRYQSLLGLQFHLTAFDLWSLVSVKFLLFFAELLASGRSDTVEAQR